MSCATGDRPVVAITRKRRCTCDAAFVLKQSLPITTQGSRRLIETISVVLLVLPM